MNWMVLVLGMALAVAGGLSMYSGNDIIQVERGWAWVIAGAALTAGGFVTFAIGLVMFRLDELRQALVSAHAPKPLAEATGLELIKVSAGAVPVAVQPEVQIETADARAAPVQPVSANAPALGDDWLDGALAGRIATPATLETVQTTDAMSVLTGASKTTASQNGAAPAERTILGRYKASNISYAMYSDGSIDADDGISLRHFNSMEDLKAHISSAA